MKKLITLAVILACLSVAYYFGVALPSKQNIELQEKCFILAKKYFDEQKASTEYRCHYNKRLNKFLLYTTRLSLPTTKYEEIRDLLSNETLGWISDDAKVASCEI